jgi:hypothetical protein
LIFHREEQNAALISRFSVQDTHLSAEKLPGASNILKFSAEIMPGHGNASSVKSVVSVYHEDELVAHLISRLELAVAE